MPCKTKFASGFIDTPEESYENGYETGLTWNADWIPGGPFVCSGRLSMNDKEWLDYCEMTRINNEKWKEGWKDGLIKQNPDHPLLSRC